MVPRREKKILQNPKPGSDDSVILSWRVLLHLGDSEDPQMFLLPCPITTPIVHPFRTLKPRRQPPQAPECTPSHPLSPFPARQPPSLSTQFQFRCKLETTNHRAAAASGLDLGQRVYGDTCSAILPSAGTGLSVSGAFGSDSH